MPAREKYIDWALANGLGFLKGDVGLAGAAQHELAGLLQLGEVGLGHAQRDVGAREVGQHGDDVAHADLGDVHII